VEDDIVFGPENLGVPRAEIKERIDFALKAVNMEKFRYSSPERLSGGQKQRIAIAGVLALKPEILVLDEPSAGLDPLGKKEMMSLLHDIHRAWCKTVIVVSHDMDEVAENCNRIALFVGGKALRVDTPNQLFDTDFAKDEGGLDIPFIAALTHKLQELGVDARCPYTLQGFVNAVVQAGGTKHE
jgi:energy-coupling factor transport system ATP-binding protein